MPSMSSSFLEVDPHAPRGGQPHRQPPGSAAVFQPRETLAQAYEQGKISGFRNAQTTVIAPTGTIGFMMDCDTTGIEPDLALVKYKKLVGGGVIKIVNNTVPQRSSSSVTRRSRWSRSSSHIDSTGTIEGAPGLKAEHLAVFDCSFRPQNGARSIHHMGHVRMMAAVQPFISGAISKTINMPEECTVEEVMDAYIESWRLGLKAVAIYRDKSKRVQPLSSGTGKGEKMARRRSSRAGSCGEDRLPSDPPQAAGRTAVRSRTSSPSAATKATSPSACTRTASPGEVFITMAKEGSTISGLMDSFATAVSYRAAVRRAVEVLRRQVQPRAVRAERLDRQSAGALREVDHGLHLPLDGREIPRAGICDGRSGRDAEVAADEAESAAGAAVRSGRRRCAIVLGMRGDHDPKWILLQVRELRRYQRL